MTNGSTTTGGSAGVPDPDHAVRLDLGAYLVGSLAPAERAVVDRHLAVCARCRAELAELAPLPGLLARIDPDEARNQTLTPSPDLLPGALAAVRRQQATDRRRLLRWRVGAAMAAAAAVIAVALAAVPALVPGGSSPAPGTPGVESVPFVEVADTAATGIGTMEAKGWGTALQLNLNNLPPATAYQAFAMSRDGRQEVAATWGPTPTGRATVNGATAIQRRDLAAIEVRTIDGRDLLHLPC